MRSRDGSLNLAASAYAGKNHLSGDEFLQSRPQFIAALGLMAALAVPCQAEPLEIPMAGI